ncbi:GRIP and coiled-coil domain-containing protein 2 [Phthorimaea operculella]|nr:GRIP and coiled-coil domain-containing protein 2 [Phthorimaea operculella]
MSETDDTDVLLLIPPDFFLVHSSGSDNSLLESSRTVVHRPPSCTAQVIGKLVDQVHSLESRLESLELNTTVTESSLGSVARRKNWDTDSFDSKSYDNKYFTFPRRRRRKVFKRERPQDLSLTSLDSFSTLPSVPRLKLKETVALPRISKGIDLNDSKSMDGDLSSIVSTPSKKNDKLLLNEIDEFLTKVEAYETPESKYKEIDSSVSPENVIRATGDYITSKLDTKNDDKLPSSKTESTSVLDKYIYLVKSNPQSATRSENEMPSTSALKMNESSANNPSKSTIDATKKEIPQNTESKSPSIRKLNFTEKEVQPTSTPKKTISYLDSFKPSSNKIYDRASKVLEQYKSQSNSRSMQNSLTDSYLLKEDFKMPQMRPFAPGKESLRNKFMESVDTDLLSLSDLWGDKGDKDRGDSSKLEEERLKREHCEALIQQLQKKLLDQQEKLAVAMKVDRAKDIAIAKLKDSWMKLTASLDRAEERHRQGMDKVLREAENFKQVANEAQKKTNHFEAELYKALDLAHDYQEKCKQLTSQTREAKETMDKALAEKDEVIARKEKEIEVLKDNYETVMRLNKQSTDCAKNLEDALAKEKSDHEITKNKITELLRKIQSAEDDTSLLQQEKDLLRDKLNEERARADMLQMHLEERQNCNSDLLRKCDNLDTEVKTLRKHMELQKNELKTHYQKQLEDAVLAKLTEFQHQLDLAEREMENDSRGREQHIVDTYNKQIARIEEQHKLEINVLEEKQKEEINLYRLQLAQASEKIGLLENKLDTYRRRRGQIASQLHSVMEAQWRQALLILTNNPSSSLDLTRTDSVSTPVAQDYAPPKIPPLTMPTFDKRLQRSEQHNEVFNFEGLSDNELQQYVKLLLTKPPTDGAGDGAAPSGGDRDEEPTSDRPDKERKAKRSLGGKPPWKA